VWINLPENEEIRRSCLPWIRRSCLLRREAAKMCSNSGQRAYHCHSREAILEIPVQEHHITKTFTFPDFRQALAFVNKVGEMAEEQGHHPDIYLTWGKVEIRTWTHKIDGLTESDFILAAKIDQLARS